MKIEFWGDFTCPYTYIGSSSLKKAVKNLGLDAEITMKSYELHPDMPQGKWQSTMDALMQDDGLTREEAEEKIAAVDAYGKENGLSINFAGDHFCNTRDAHRLVCYAQSVDLQKANRLVDRIFNDVMAEGKLICDQDVLIEAAKEAGLDPKKAAQVLEDGSFLDEVLAQEKEAEEIPIESIPYFVIDNTVIDSSHGVKDFEKILKDLQK